jgi:hypothetical protein
MLFVFAVVVVFGMCLGKIIVKKWCTIKMKKN